MLLRYVKNANSVIWDNCLASSLPPISDHCPTIKKKKKNSFRLRNAKFGSCEKEGRSWTLKLIWFSTIQHRWSECHWTGEGQDDTHGTLHVYVLLKLSSITSPEPQLNIEDDWNYFISKIYFVCQYSNQRHCRRIENLEINNFQLAL